MQDDTARPLQPGQLLARGVARHLESLGFSALFEFVPARGLRVDVIGIGRGGEIWIVECKSSRTDFMSDSKWHGYVEWCDRYFWAVDQAFPTDLLPEDTGLIIADAYDGEVLRMPPETRMAPARRKAMMLKLARTATERLWRLTDTGPPGLI